VGSIGLPEILVVLVVALVVLGPKRLPDAARQLGKAMAEFRRMSAGLQAEVRDVFNDPLPVVPPPPPSPAPDEKPEP
jgi:Tat protein translocase TatB subunit